MLRRNNTNHSSRTSVRQLTDCKLQFDHYHYSIERCGKEVHYVMNYYNDESINDEFKVAFFNVGPSVDIFGNTWHSSLKILETVTHIHNNM